MLLKAQASPYTNLQACLNNTNQRKLRRKWRTTSLLDQTVSIFFKASYDTVSMSTLKRKVTSSQESQTKGKQQPKLRLTF